MVTFEHSKIDPITAYLEKGIKWIIKHKQPFTVITGTILIGGLFSTYVIYHVYKLRKIYWDRLAIAQGLMSQKKFDEAIKNINEIKARQISGVLLTHADLLKGDIYFYQKKYPDAINTYKEAYNVSKKDELRALALSNIGTSQEQNGQIKEAIATYKQFIEKYPEHFLTARIYNSLARLQTMTGSISDAEATYERLITLYPTSIWAKSARIYIANLKNQNRK